MLNTAIRRRRIAMQLSPLDIKLRTGIEVVRLGEIERGVGPALTEIEIQLLKELDLYPRPFVRG